MRTLVLSVSIVLFGCAAHRDPDAGFRVPIVFTTPGDAATGELGGMVVPILHRGRIGFLAIDTGSALTFLYLGEDGPEYRPRAGTVQIGGERFDLPGRGFGADDETGIGIVGVLGADYFLSAPAVFDPARFLITRGQPAPPPPAGTSIPFDNVEGHIIVRLTVDGRELRLMWDTGCPHLLWLGQEGRPGDSMSMGQDIEGGLFPMFLGEAELSLHGEAPRPVAALRVPSFPYYEGVVAALGGGIDGLCGQSVFGARSMTFDAAAGVIRLGPASPPNP